MIDFQNVSKGYGGQVILDNVSFRINSGEQVGLVGPNGAGKSTIFGIITNEIAPDNGNVALPKNLRVGYLRQHLSHSELHESIVDFTADAIPKLKELRDEIRTLERRLESNTDDREKLLHIIGDHQKHFEDLGGYELKHRAEIALSGLGFKESAFANPVDSFSGGWQMRAALARVLISDPDILLLDEPSNYLDIPAIEWLERFMRNFKGTLLLISHDRHLLKTLTRVTLEINGGQISRYAGDYDYYVRERDERLRHVESAKRNQDREKERMERFVERFRAKSTKASLVKSQIKKLERMDDIILPGQLKYKGSINIPEAPKCGNEILSLENASFSYDGQKWVLKDVDLQIMKGEKVALVGYNGTGKTTLLKCVARELTLSSGNHRYGQHVVVGYQPQEFGEILSSDSTVLDVIRASATPSTLRNVRNILGSFGFSDETVNKPCGVLSGGEKIRLCFARIFVNPPNFLLLDEPTTHLDVFAREALQDALSKYNGTVCFVSHDIEFVRAVADTIIAMKTPDIKKYFGNFDYYHEKMAEEESTNVPKTTNEYIAEKHADNKKLKRKERAEKRRELGKTLNPLKKQVAKFEAEIETLESEKEKIVAALAENSPDLDFAALNKRMSEVIAIIDDLTGKWEETSIQIEKINAEMEEE